VSPGARANEELIRAFYAARAAGEPLEPYLTPDVVWDVPGTSLIGGRHEGLEAVLGYIARRDEMAAGTLDIELHHVIARDNNALILSTSRASRGDRHRESPGAALIEVRDGRIARCRLIPADQQAFDDFWS